MWPDWMYFHPVKESYRYHFIRSPRPVVSNSSNVKGIMKRGNPFKDRSASRLSPMDGPGRQNERAELDYRIAPDMVLSNAPFGTNKTSNIEMRIVGGRYIPVIEEIPRFKDEYAQRQIQPLNPITLPPTQIDPRNSLDADYYKDVQPTALVNKRPDSKDIARLQYKTLPPIQLNRHRNDLSTVFEAESWTRNQQPSLARDTEYKHNYHPSFDENGQPESHWQQTNIPDIHVTKEEERELFKTLPKNVLLPADAIKLSREQEHTALKVICKDLRDFDSKLLQDVYMECSQHDRDLDGFCTIEILDHCLRRYGAQLSDTLRIIAAQFLDPRQPGKTNYEKVLSFIGSALEMHRKGQLTDKPRYYTQNEDDGFKSGSLAKDREVAKLLKMVEQQLSTSTYSMDWTKWRNLFHEKDRDHRETLSRAQIKDICYDCNLPLSDSLINAILSHCEDNNRDGQFRWQAFLDFISRVLQSNTGLPIPVSKRPLEYAKHYPTPVANWPRTDTDAVEQRREQQSPRREPSPRRGEYYKQEPKQYDERGKSPQRDIPPSRDRQERQDKPDTIDRGKSPQRDIPPSRDRQERQDKPDLIDRRKYSPDRNSYSYDRSPERLPPVQFESPRSNDNNWSPAYDQYRSPVEYREHDRSADEFRDYRHQSSGGYKASWQEDKGHDHWQKHGNEHTHRHDHEHRQEHQHRNGHEHRHGHRHDQRRAEMSQNWTQGSEMMSPRWTQPQDRDKREPTPNHYNADQGFQKDRQYVDANRYMNRDPYDRAIQAWAQPNRQYNSYQSRLNRPRSYAEPQRIKTPLNGFRRPRPLSYRDVTRGPFHDTVYDQAQGRLRTPVFRSRSLSPIRYLSPVPGQQYQHPSTYREQQQVPYSYRQQQQPHYPNSYEQQQRHQVYPSGYQEERQQVQNGYTLKAPYLEDYNAQQFPIEFQRQQQYNSSFKQQQPKYASLYNDQFQPKKFAQDRFPYNFQRDDGTRYEQQQQHYGHQSPTRPNPEDQYRRHDNPPYEDRQEKIRHLSKELEQLQSSYNFARETLKNSEKPWLDRYLKLAQALYNIDIHNSGKLPRTDVLDLVRQYNDAYKLKLDMTRANMLAISPENLDRSGNILLRPYLACLCGDSFKQRI